MNAIDYIKNAINRVSAERDKKLKAIRSGSCRDVVKAAAEFTAKRDTALELYGLLSSIASDECLCFKEDDHKILYDNDKGDYAMISSNGVLSVVKDYDLIMQHYIDFCPFCGGRFRRSEVLDEAKPLPTPGDRVYAIVKDGAALVVKEVECVIGQDSDLTLESRLNALTATQYTFPLKTWREWVFYTKDEAEARLEVVMAQ